MRCRCSMPLSELFPCRPLLGIADGELEQFPVIGAGQVCIEPGLQLGMVKLVFRG